jgi:ABC-2 type transport system ATP-binding protein
MNVVETNTLTKIYSSAFGKKKVQALSDFSILIPDGMIFGLLGPNGAGKTTLVKILLGITYPTFGTAKILGEGISNYKIKKRVGYLPENHKFPSYLTGQGVLEFFGKLSGLEKSVLKKKVYDLLELVKLTQWKKTKIKAYSKGMMQRLGLAQALLNDPDLIFLDEPTDGVDPIGRKEIRDVLLELKSRSKTIFLNSHLLSEVELITDRVGILNKGKLIREGTVQELTEKKEEYKINLEGSIVPDALKELLQQFNFNPDQNNTYIAKVSDVNELNKLIDTLRSKNVLIKNIIPFKTSLEEMFISLIKQADSEKTQ